MFDSLIRRAANGDRAAEAIVEKKAPPRPTIALALGGGIARGFAHIGVLHALAKHGFEPDIVVGTSVGSVVGACYAFGRLDELEQWALGLTTRGVLGYLDVSLGGSGLIGGDRLAARLDQTFGDARIEDMPKRYACIATELGTGHEIWLTRGRIVDAVRASYALPGIFRPVHLGGRWLVDGALVNPVPVSAARALGARLVIAVNLNSEIFGRGGTIASHGTDEEDTRIRNEMRTRPEGFRSMLSPEFLLRRHLVGGRRSPNIMNIMIDSFNVMQDRITRSRLAGDPSDVTISPRMGKIGLFDFHRAKEAIAIGESAAERAIPEVTEAIAALT